MHVVLKTNGVLLWEGELGTPPASDEQVKVMPEATFSRSKQQRYIVEKRKWFFHIDTHNVVCEVELVEG